MKFLTSLSFLYAIVILALVVYGWYYYREFARSARQRKIFPVVFLAIGLACFGFLWINLHPPLSLKTFSNLDHHFIRHDGFVVRSQLELGRTDTVNFRNNPYNSFVFAKKGESVTVSSSYSEEPFYIVQKNEPKIASKIFAAPGHSLSLTTGATQVLVKTTGDSFELQLGGQPVSVTRDIRKAISLWNLFKDNSTFITSAHSNTPGVANALRQLWVVRQQGEDGGLYYFVSGAVFRHVASVSYDQQVIAPPDLAFRVDIPVHAEFAWGIGFSSNNRNHFSMTQSRNDSFVLKLKYPVSYPLTGEDRSDWSARTVTKFLVADPSDMVAMPSVFREGFMFPYFEKGAVENFGPLLITEQRDAGNKSLQLKARPLFGQAGIAVDTDKWLLPARQPGLHWAFSINDSSRWDFGSLAMAPGTWKLWMFGSLFLFFVVVLVSSIVFSPTSISWVWQLLSAITLVLLTTRFFLYWRYKTFPPYEGMDLPSQQQLDSFGNFGVIIGATIVLAIIFGFPLGRHLLSKPGRKNSVSPGMFKLVSENMAKRYEQSRLVERFGSKAVFFGAWISILIGAAGIAWIRNFDPGTCRHLAIFLVIAYFFFIYLSYRHSPLVVDSARSWWRINTGKVFDIIVSNPVKVLLSISLLALFVFIDIGFAIVFLNFLFFNEAFLCINYGIAGLSAGSKRNAALFGVLGGTYLVAFTLNLLFAPYIFRSILNMPQGMYLAAYALFSLLLAYNFVRLMATGNRRRTWMIGSSITVVVFAMSLLFFPRQRIVDKAAMTKYRIDVLTMPVEEAIESAYAEGKSYRPVIRAAQNQWFINTLIYEKNNPGVKAAGFQMLPHSPQNKGAKYNAQATDLVASRFFLAEHGNLSVLFYMLLLILPTVMLASFYRLYPDFTNRTNSGYPVVTAGFSIMNFLLITALLVILAATGRYIFFGQDMPFGSILSKQSILFPSILIITTVLLFSKIPIQYYANRKKLFPGLIIFLILGFLLFGVKPVFNKNKEFNVSGLAGSMEEMLSTRLQPILDHFDTSRATSKLSVSKKDKLFTDSLRALISSGQLSSEGSFFGKEADAYSKLDFSAHLDQNRLIYLDLYSGRPELSINENYFRIEPPPHLQQAWKGNVYGDSTNFNVSLLNCDDGVITSWKLSSAGNNNEPTPLCNDLELLFSSKSHQLQLVNKGTHSLTLVAGDSRVLLAPGHRLGVGNPSTLLITGAEEERLLSIEPDAFMRNFHVNGSRFYVYPLGSKFIWARNFAEGIAGGRSTGATSSDAFISLDLELTDSLVSILQQMMQNDTAYGDGAEFGISIADGDGKLIAIADHIKGLARPDPNDKAGFNRTLQGENGYVAQSTLRKQVGNINLLRMNPGPGSTLKPLIFSAIASQLDIDWDNFASSGFTGQLDRFGGERVAEYDFEKDNGHISKVSDYLKYSDNYYHANVLLLGSYPKQATKDLLGSSFQMQNPGVGLHWPNFRYKNRDYWMDGFKNWPGYANREANFGLANSYSSIGLLSNFNIVTRPEPRRLDMFQSAYDSSLLGTAYRSGFILPEYSVFDQAGETVSHRIPYDVFASCFRGHVKGSSQVMIPPVKMVEAFGRLVSQDKGYSLSFATGVVKKDRQAFDVDNTIAYNSYLQLMREGVFKGMEEALYRGTAAALGALLKKGDGYFYYAKTGTTGDNESRTKSKLMVVVISEKDLTAPGFNFRDNKFYTLYFTMQNGPAKQNEQFLHQVIRMVQHSSPFTRYMGKTKGQSLKTAP